MATTGSISITQNSQDIANNKSSITVKGTATTTGESHDLYTRTGTITIDGKNYSFSTTFPKNTTKTIFTKTVDITHNADGKKTVRASFSIKTGMAVGTLTASTSKTLTTIPRTSKVTINKTNFNIGETLEVYTNRASSSFTHTIVITFNGKTVHTRTNIKTSIEWNTIQLYQYLTSGSKGTGTVTLTTYNGSTKIGTSSVNFTANAVKSNVTISTSNFNIGVNSVTIYTNRASSTLTHTIKIVFNGSTVRTQTGVGASYLWYTSELYKYIPNANRGTGTITLTTYNGSTNIGSSSVSFTANVTSSNPTFSNFEVADVNSKTLALTGNKNKYIKKYSNAKVTISTANKMVAKNSATAKQYNVIAGNISRSLTYSSSSAVSTTINNIDANAVSVYAIDSRNNQTSVSKSLTVITYNPIVIQSLKIDRKDGVGESMLLTASGTYHNINFGAVTNSVKTIQMRTKKSTLTTWGNWINIKGLFTVANGTFKITSKEIPSQTFILGVEYDVQLQVSDELSSDTENGLLSSGKVLMSAVKDMGVCFGGIYDKSIGGPLQIVDENENRFRMISEVITNSNGTAIKYPDGIMICYGSVRNQPSVTSTKVSLPSSFVNTEYIVTTTNKYTYYITVIHTIGMGDKQKDSFSVYPYDVKTNAVPNNYSDFFYIAIGRWK